MTPRVFCAVLFGFFLYVCQASWAHAQEPAEAASALDELISQGIVLRRSGRDREALTLFKQAEALSPQSARVQVHLAATHQALGDWLRADEYMRQALGQANDPFIQQHLGTLELAQKTIDEHMALIEIDGSPAGAEVRLNGQLAGQLPLRQPIRMVAGSYTLELSRPGYFSARRPINVIGGELWREVLHLSRDSAAQRPASPAAASVQVRDTADDRLAWLPWTLGGLGITSAGVSALAWFSRERHAERWNDDARCQRPGRTREDVCSAERVATERAELVFLASSLAAGLFTGATVLTLLSSEPSAEASERSELACGLKGAWLACSGHF